ncbi:MAG: hypothetical protein ACLVL7_09310 [Anaerotruncus massiliensis (ex Togo et al. 2019)]
MKKEEGGRHTVLQQLSSAVLFPYHRRDRRRLLPEGIEMCMPGDNVEMDVELITEIAIERPRFAIREAAVPLVRALSSRSTNKIP